MRGGATRAASHPGDGRADTDTDDERAGHRQREPGLREVEPDHRFETDWTKGVRGSASGSSCSCAVVATCSW